MLNFLSVTMIDHVHRLISDNDVGVEVETVWCHPRNIVALKSLGEQLVCLLAE